MSYKINEVKINGDTINVKVEYTLTDGSILNAIVDVFAPDGKGDVLSGIASREETEEARLIIRQKNELVKVQLEQMIVAT